MIVVTVPEIQGYRIVKTLGLVRGSTVRGMHVGQDIMAVLRNLVGGEIDEYTKMLAEAREQALDRMIENAEKIGANAIIGALYGTSDIASGAAEILIYGTAVVVEPVIQPAG
ncbi:MAG: YbjQ family protein [Candidatus Hydrogenedentes bacterium]|nr:YbjQ family protein [Candidatus Hydrogenedentota bacterium]